MLHVVLVIIALMNGKPSPPLLAVTKVEYKTVAECKKAMPEVTKSVLTSLGTKIPGVQFKAQGDCLTAEQTQALAQKLGLAKVEEKTKEDGSI
ncbi:MAG: hypothetical protein ACXV2C_00440 [Candidatus Bathyarchaeia archaeon]